MQKRDVRGFSFGVRLSLAEEKIPSAPIQRVLRDEQTANALDKRLTEECFRDIEGIEW